MNVSPGWMTGIGGYITGQMSFSMAAARWVVGTPKVCRTSATADGMTDAGQLTVGSHLLTTDHVHAAAGHDRVTTLAWAVGADGEQAAERALPERSSGRFPRDTRSP
jgi:hypothetical protein